MFVFFIYSILSCQDEGKVGGIGNFVIKIDQTVLNSSVLIDNIESAIITVEDESGLSVFDSEEIILSGEDKFRASKVFKLKQGNYSLRKFLLKNKYGEVVFASPRRGSEKAQIVKKPLNLNFRILPEKETILSPDVISTRAATSKEFGYLDTTFDLIENLVVYYPFDGSVSDYSGNNNHAIDYSNKIYVDGVLGQAHNFNGSSDYLQLMNTVDATNGLTVSFWIYSRGTDGFQNNGCVLSKYNMTGSRGFLINTFGTWSDKYRNELSGHFYSNPETSDYRDCTFSGIKNEGEIPINLIPAAYKFVNPREIELNKWTHCVINVTDVEVQAWIDGELTVSKTREYIKYNDDALTPTVVGTILFGGKGTNNFLNGYLDELRIYNRPLTENEIATLAAK